MLGRGRQDRRDARDARRLEVQEIEDAKRVSRLQMRMDKADANVAILDAKAATTHEEADWKSKLIKALPWIAGAGLLAIIVLKKRRK